MTTPYRILITGARDWTDDGTVEAALERAVTEAGSKPVVVVHGGCPSGADALANRWAVNHDYLGVDVEAYPADWIKHGKAAGFRRNAQMVDLGADICLAFIKPCQRLKPACRDQPPHDSHGTAHCANLARRAGILVIEVRG